MAGTVDQISHGRFTLSIGAAWFQREHEAYGWDFPPMKERSDRLEEACALLRALFTADGPVDFEGRYYRLDQAPLSPGGYNNRQIPIMVGGTGERRTLRTLARYGDIMNLDGWAGGPMTQEYYFHKVGVLEQHCENVGRDPSRNQAYYPDAGQGHRRFRLKLKPSSPVAAWVKARRPDPRTTLLNASVSLWMWGLMRSCLRACSLRTLSSTTTLKKRFCLRLIEESIIRL